MITSDQIKVGKRDVKDEDGNVVNVNYEEYVGGVIVQQILHTSKDLKGHEAPSTEEIEKQIRYRVLNTIYGDLIGPLNELRCLVLSVCDSLHVHEIAQKFEDIINKVSP